MSGSLVLGSLESIADNLLLREISHDDSVPIIDHQVGKSDAGHGHRHDSDTADDSKFYQDDKHSQQGLPNIHSAPQFNTATQQGASNVSGQPRCNNVKKPRLRTVHYKKKPTTKKRSRKHVISKRRSHHLIKSINLTKLSPFSSPYHDDDGMSAATGRSVTSASVQSNEPSIGSSLEQYDRNRHLHSNHYGKSFSSGHDARKGVTQNYVVGYAYPAVASAPAKITQSQNVPDNLANCKHWGENDENLELSSFNDIDSSDHVSDGYDGFDNHLVLILSSSGTKETISAHALMLPIIHILTRYRAHRFAYLPILTIMLYHGFLWPS